MFDFFVFKLNYHFLNWSVILLCKVRVSFTKQILLNFDENSCLLLPIIFTFQFRNAKLYFRFSYQSEIRSSKIYFTQIIFLENVEIFEVKTGKSRKLCHSENKCWPPKTHVGSAFCRFSVFYFFRTYDFHRKTEILKKVEKPRIKRR